jgi:uncharacterized protein YxjI
MADIYEDSEYLIRRKVFSFPAAKFHVYNSRDELVLFVKQRAFKLKEDIRVYSDESMGEERLLIKARNIVDFSAAYDVMDSTDGKKLGALRRKGMKSILRDTWEFLDEADRVVAHLGEDSMALATVRRFLSNLVPQTFHVSAGNQQFVTYKQHFNPFIFKLDVLIAPAGRDVLDPRLVLAGGILLGAIEGRQG